MYRVRAESTVESFMRWLIHHTLLVKIIKKNVRFFFFFFFHSIQPQFLSRMQMCRAELHLLYMMFQPAVVPVVNPDSGGVLLEPQSGSSCLPQL